VSNIYPEDGDGSRGPDTAPEAQETTGANSVREKLGEVKETVKQEAGQLAADAQARAKDKVSEKQQAVGGALHEFADAVRGAGERLGEGEQTQASALVRQAADALESLSRNMAEKTPGEMLDQARSLGRSNPTALLIGSVVAGVAIGRFLRSASEPAAADAYPGAYLPSDNAAPMDESAAWMEPDFQSEDAYAPVSTASGPGEDALDLSPTDPADEDRPPFPGASPRQEI
jgi:hypothetical protein